jgi:hypothetical protein
MWLKPRSRDNYAEEISLFAHALRSIQDPSRHKETIPEYETAVLALNRNAAIAIYALSSCNLYTGR